MVNYVFIESLQCSPHHCYRGSSGCGIFWSSSTLCRRSQSCRGTRGRGSKTEHVCQMQYITYVCLYTDTSIDFDVQYETEAVRIQSLEKILPA